MIYNNILQIDGNWNFDGKYNFNPSTMLKESIKDEIIEQLAIGSENTGEFKQTYLLKLKNKKNK